MRGARRRGWRVAKGRQLARQPHGGAIRVGGGNPRAKETAGRKDMAYRIRAQKMLEDAQALEYLKNVITGVEGDTIIAKRIELVEENGERRRVVVTAFQQIPAKVRDRIEAVQTLEAAAGYVTRPAAPAPVVQAQFVVFAPPKAKTTAEWLKMHKLGRA